MNFQKKKKLNVPANLEKFLIELTVEILIHNPSDLNEFGYKYFKAIHEKKLPDSASKSSNDLAENSRQSLDDLQVNTQRSDESDDELQELDWFDNKKSQSRRCSVFNKAYDPVDEVDHSEANSLPGDVSSEILENSYSEEANVMKSSGQKTRLKDVLRSIVIFKYLYDDELDEIVEAMFMRSTVADETIIREGDDGYYFYVIFDGVYEIFLQSQVGDVLEVNAYGKKYSEYRNEGFFGELSLLYDQPRSATIISKGDGILFCMHRDKFKKLVIGNSFNRSRNYENFLKSIPLLTFSLSEYEITQVADSLVTCEFNPGECVFRQDDVADGMYFIEKGSVRVFQEKEMTVNEEKQVEIRELKEGEFFGELALVNKAARSASVFCSNEAACKLVFLELEAFERLIGPCREFIKYKIVTYNVA